MFQKVLIAEDFDTINLALTQVIKDLGITQVDHVKYCDDAILKMKKAILDQQPYDLLISDLSFKEDHRKVTIASGDDLIKEVRVIQPELPIVVYSVEEKSYRIQSLFEDHNINGYVLKGPESIKQLKQALQVAAKEGERFISPEIAHSIQNKTTHQIDQFDIEILKHLAEGILQEEMETVFKQKGITPNSKSTIEKRISKLKIIFKANNAIHLIALAKDMGII
jgi:two-component system capsular synthesis response regulator RcsB